MVKLIRLEFNDGYGIFRSYNNHTNESRWSVNIGSSYNNNSDSDRNICTMIVDRHDKFNTPFEDGFKWMTKNHFCGFKNFKQITEWFNMNELKFLINKGCKIYSISVSEIEFEGEFQVIYYKDKIIEKTDITEIFINYQIINH